MASILTDMKIRDYAQLLGIVQDIPDVDEHLKQNVKVSDLPEPHCNELISGQPTFYSFKSMLVMLMLERLFWMRSVMRSLVIPPRFES